MAISPALQVLITNLLRVERWITANNRWAQIPGDSPVGEATPVSMWNYPRTRTVEFELTGTNAGHYRVVFSPELPYAQGEVVINAIMEVYGWTKPQNANNATVNGVYYGWWVAK